MDIRKARAGDRPIVQAFLDQLASALAADAVIFVDVEFGTVFDLFLTGKRGVVLLAEDAEGVLGMASVSYNLGLRFGGEYAQLEELIVAEAARGRKVGSALVEAAIAEARRHGCKEIGLYAVERNRPFYEKHGFTYTGPEMRRPL